MPLYIYKGIRNQPLGQVKYKNLIFFSISVEFGQNREKIYQLVKKKPYRPNFGPIRLKLNQNVLTYTNFTVIQFQGLNINIFRVTFLTNYFRKFPSNLPIQNLLKIMDF